MDSAAPAPQPAAGVKEEEAPAQQERQQQAAAPAAAPAAKPPAAAAAGGDDGSDSDDDAPLLARKAAVKQGELTDRVRDGPAVLQGPNASPAAAHAQCCAAARTRRPCAPPTPVCGPPALLPCGCRACVQQQARTQGQGSSGEEGGRLGPPAGAATPCCACVGWDNPACCTSPLPLLQPAPPLLLPRLPRRSQHWGRRRQPRRSQQPRRRSRQPRRRQPNRRPRQPAAARRRPRCGARSRGCLCANSACGAEQAAPADACDVLPSLPARSQLAVWLCQLAVLPGCVESPSPQPHRLPACSPALLCSPRRSLTCPARRATRQWRCANAAGCSCVCRSCGVPCHLALSHVQQGWVPLPLPCTPPASHNHSPSLLPAAERPAAPLLYQPEAAAARQRDGHQVRLRGAGMACMTRAS